MATYQPRFSGPDHLVGGHAHVLEVDLVEAVVAGHVDQGPHLDAGRPHVGHEVGDAAMLGRVRVGAGEHVDPVGVVGARGPDLLPVDDEVVPVADGAGLQRGQVGSRSRLAVALGPGHLGGRDGGQELALLVLAAVQHQAGAHHADALHVHGRARQRRLLAVDHLLDVARAAAAVLLRPGHRQPAVLGHALLEGAGRGLRLVGRGPLGRRRPLPRDELAHLPAEGLIFCAEAEIHLRLHAPNRRAHGRARSEARAVCIGRGHLGKPIAHSGGQDRGREGGAGDTSPPARLR